MNPPERIVKIIGRKKYDVMKATLLAGNDYWDGHNWERNGRNTWLYLTPHGSYFTFTRTKWQGERDCLEPITQEHAIELYETTLTEHRVNYAEAFPGVEVVEA